MNLNLLLILVKNWFPILLISLSEVNIYINCGTISSRLRNPDKGSASWRSFNQRRRDITVATNPDPPPDQNSRGQPIVFSEPIASQRSRTLLPDLDSKGRPKCLSNPEDTFCESVPNYPNVTIKKEIDFAPMEFLEIFGTKDIDGRKSYIDDDLTEERVCKRIPKVIYPQMAKNQANQWVYVVNEVEYTQAVVAEICEKEGKSCAYLDRNLPPGMYSRCRQKYSYKRLLALHPTEKRTYSDRFKFPSCCACYVKSNDILSRSLRSDEKRSRRRN